MGKHVYDSLTAGKLKGGAVMQRKHNGQRQTRKKYREEKARQDRKGLIILTGAYYFGRLLIALVFEYLRLINS